MSTESEFTFRVTYEMDEHGFWVWRIYIDENLLPETYASAADAILMRASAAGEAWDDDELVALAHHVKE
jgi:hypothetical protein